MRTGTRMSCVVHIHPSDWRAESVYRNVRNFYTNLCVCVCVVCTAICTPKSYHCAWLNWAERKRLFSGAYVKTYTAFHPVSNLITALRNESIYFFRVLSQIELSLEFNFIRSCDSRCDCLQQGNSIIWNIQKFMMTAFGFAEQNRSGIVATSASHHVWMFPCNAHLWNIIVTTCITPIYFKSLPLLHFAATASQQTFSYCMMMIFNVRSPQVNGFQKVFH